MKDARYFYLVRFWAAPAAEARVLAWIDGGHSAELVALPGFLWCRRIRLAEVDALGWRGFINVYGLDSEAALTAYFADASLRERFGREAGAFAGAMRSERLWGAADGPFLHSA